MNYRLTKAAISCIIVIVSDTETHVHEWLSGGVSPCQGEGRGFESRLVLYRQSGKSLKIQAFPLFFVSDKFVPSCTHFIMPLKSGKIFVPAVPTSRHTKSVPFSLQWIRERFFCSFDSLDILCGFVESFFDLADFVFQMVQPYQD